MTIKFGTGGFRAIMGEDFTKSNLQKIIQAICNIINQDNLKQTVFIGYDNRFMSDQYAKWASEVFCGNNVNVVLSNKPSTTPIVNYYAKKHSLDFSVAITASHNPYEYNGIKVFTNGGIDALPNQTKRIEEIANSLCENDIKFSNFDTCLNSSKVQYTNIEDEYLTSLLKLVKIDKTPSVCFDCMYGSSFDLINKLTDKLKIKNSKIIHGERNAFFGFSMPSPTPATVHDLSSLIASKSFELGLALDGDGDRLAIIDKNGKFVDNNELMSCLYYYFNKYKGKHGDIVKTISTTNLLDILANKFNQKCHTVNVGFKFVSDKIIQTNAILGGESSGGLAIREHILAKDSLLSIVLLFDMMSNMNKSIDQIIKEVKTYANFDCSYEEKQYKLNNKDEIIKAIFNQKQLPNLNKLTKQIIYEDYFKIIYADNTWTLIRFSGTEPVMRIYTEQNTATETQSELKLWETFLAVEN